MTGVEQALSLFSMPAFEACSTATPIVVTDS